MTMNRRLLLPPRRGNLSQAQGGFPVALFESGLIGRFVKQQVVAKICRCGGLYGMTRSLYRVRDTHAVDSICFRQPTRRGEQLAISYMRSHDARPTRDYSIRIAQGVPCLLVIERNGREARGRILEWGRDPSA